MTPDESLASSAVRNAFDRPLRVGVLLDSLVVPRWIHSILTSLQTSDYARIELVIVNGGSDQAPTIVSRLRRLPQVPFVLYSRLDYLLFRRKVRHDAFAPTDAGDALDGVSTISVVVQRGKWGDRFSDEDVDAVQAQDLDVLLRLGFRTIRGRMLHAARHGVWSYQHGDGRRYRGGPPLLGEIVDRTSVSGTLLQILPTDSDAGRVIYRSFAKTDFTSLFRNRNETFWKTARFMERRLSDLHRLGPDALDSATGVGGDLVPTPDTPRVPGPVRVTTFAVRAGVEIARAQLRHQTTNGHWFVAWAPRESGLPGIDAIPSFREVPSPPGHFLADPFLAEHDGRTFAFVECCPHRRSAGVIAVLELRGDSVSEPVTVLDRGYHLSYPAVFRWDDEWFMTPESSSNRTIELYRAVEFPWRWELDTVLLSGVDAVDPTLFQHDGLWWLYANIASLGGSYHDELHLFWADSPRGPFIAHSANPVVSDVRRARPAGMPITHNGNLYRPSQNNAVRYGHSMVMNRVDVLDPQRYLEVPMGQILPDWLPGAICTHTLNVSDRYVITDGLRLVPRRRRRRARHPAR
jgi:hypothetical protein